MRAKTGRIVGALNAMLMVMKGLPLAYQKDMQEDKEGTIDALDALALSIAAMTGMVRDMEPDADAHEGRGRRGLCHRDRPRRLAGAHARRCRSARRTTSPAGSSPRRPRRELPLHKLPLAEMQKIEPRITKAVFDVLSVERSVQSRTSYGGTAPKNVRAQASRWLKTLGSASAAERSAASARHMRAYGHLLWCRRSAGVAEISESLFDLAVRFAVDRRARGRLPACAACGRKGALDPPPGGYGAANSGRWQRRRHRRAAGCRAEAEPAYDQDGRPIAPAGPKQHAPPDWLID